jgi:hypothetical protein
MTAVLEQQFILDGIQDILGTNYYEPPEVNYDPPKKEEEIKIETINKDSNKKTNKYGLLEDEETEEEQNLQDEEDRIELELDPVKRNKYVLEKYKPFEWLKKKRNVKKILKKHAKMIFEQTGYLADYRKLKKNIDAIISIVGDDEIWMTNSPEKFILSLFVEEIIAKIKISWDDIGISKNIGNYAEEWVLTPPSKESNFDSITKFMRGQGTSLVFDLPKIKLLNPIRKQGQDDRLDKMSKLSQLAKPLQWIGKDWVMYDSFHNATLLSMVVYDFKESGSFPFLAESEGGQGLIPPWGNLGTVYTSLKMFKNGKSYDHVNTVVEEFTDVNRLKKSPKEAISMNLVRLAMVDPQKFQKVRDAIEQSEMSRTELYDFLKEEMSAGIPEDLLEKAIVIEPKDILIGNAIAYMRSTGRIMTELDVKLKMLSVKRQDAVTGETPMRQILEEEILDKFKARARGLHKLDTLKVYDELSRRHENLWERDRDKVDNTYKNFRSVWGEYLEERESLPSSFSALCYNDTVRVFPTEVVEAYFDRSKPRKVILESLIKIWTNYDPVRPAYVKAIKSTDKDRIATLSTEKILLSLSRGEIPPGVGQDDARILTSIKKLPPEKETIIGLFTRDRQLIRSYKQIAMKYSKKFKTLQMKPIDLRKIMERDYKKRKFLNEVSSPIIGKTFTYMEINGHTRYFLIPRTVKENMYKELYGSLIGLHSSDLNFHLEIDYPNYERDMYSMRLLFAQNSYGNRFGSYRGADKNIITRSAFKDLEEYLGFSPWMVNNIDLMRSNILMNKQK